MSVQIANLATGEPAIDALAPMQSVSENRLPVTASGTIYNLYIAPAGIGSTAARAAIVKSIRITNTYGNPAKITLYFAYTVTKNGVTKLVRRQISPSDLLLQPGFAYVDETELTLPPGARIAASAKTESGGAPVGTTQYVDFVISGVEREVT